MRLYVATGDVIVRLDEADDAWTVELYLLRTPLRWRCHRQND